MKTIAKIGSWFFCAFLVLGIAGIIVFANNGGIYSAIQKFGIVFNQNPDWNFQYDGFNISNIKFNEDSMDYKDENITSSNGIKTVTVEADVCEVELRASDVQDITTTFKSSKSSSGEYSRLDVSQKDGNLAITVKQNSKFKLFAWNSFSSASQSKLVVLLPRSYQGDMMIKGSAVTIKTDDMQNLNTFHMEVSAGAVACGNISARQISLDASASDITFGKLDAQEEANMKISTGKLTCEQLKAKSIVLDASMSDIEYRDTVGAMKAELSMGKADITFSQVLDNINIHHSTSDVSLTFPKDASIRADVKTSMQSVTDHIHWTDGQYRMKNAQYQVNIDGSMGSLVLNEK